MNDQIDVEALLAPLPGERPAGEDLRYSNVYFDIREARRADQPFALGAWQPKELKSSDWGQVVVLASDVLAKKSKDLQVAVWLTEALVATEGFEVLAQGLQVVSGLLDRYWDSCYPQIEDGDLDYRSGPLLLLNERVSVMVRERPLTDPGTTPGYSYLKWEEAREVGDEDRIKNTSGDVDEKKKKVRDELMAEGKLPMEVFTAAVARTPPAFSSSLAQSLARCRAAFAVLNELVQERFESRGPDLSELDRAINDCSDLVRRFYPIAPAAAGLQPPDGVDGGQGVDPQDALPAAPLPGASPTWEPSQPVQPPSTDKGLQENSLWDEALRIMEGGSFSAALGRLLAAANRAPSPRESNRCRLLVARLCLKAGRPELARPIAEELNALIEELHLERWEAPEWVADVLETLYICLTSDDASEEDLGRAAALFKRICALDVTKAIAYRR